MSDFSLLQILASLNAVWRQQPVTLPALTNIQWRADACDAGSVLFFQCFDGGPSDAEIYQRYLQSSRCAALVTNRQLACFDQLPDKLIVVVAPADWAQVVGRCCDLCYPLATERLHFIGVTGTNGKTTTVKYVEAMLLAHEQRVLSIGTLGLFLDGQRQLETGFTSPPQIELRRLLHEYQARCDVVVMEISSHALDQARVHGIPLHNAGWTNFTQDHLDYHHDEVSYFAAKALILNLIQKDGRLYCSSPAVAARLQAQQPAVPIELVPALTLPPAAIAAKPFLALEHNRHNYALAIALTNSLLGENARDDWQHLIAVDGRFECQTLGNHTIVIDFAHTPDALETILTAIRHGFPAARIATVFGCGGDRDRSKRPLMGAAVARHSDFCVVTSDNPRTEDPAQIITDILIGMPTDAIEKHTVIIERAEAISYVFNWLAQRPIIESWVVLIAGKGHERYIDRNGHKTPYSDQDEVARQVMRLADKL
ncbi:Mur ligase family protein [Chromatium okenii]|uniref:Mur ligase family protein n=1 Tax=Chromatium okenii TaxID=61644 RepID=UPI0026EF57D4|nr:UDP-N-acetylmuramoyl-L-alanyl-D-glutamate--2,6-diaminopimelate ligase [Chromatium okenii]MBV5309526.1 UDP-N-acetylmuramoyl-L-alanyl-D-glutamate--2,6-diaminopimelate ligase [Chromatium okenii]